jgi:hypothetical protein
MAATLSLAGYTTGKPQKRETGAEEALRLNKKHCARRMIIDQKETL